MLGICFRVLLTAGCIVAVGCSREEPGGIVRGTVTQKNKPLDKGTVVFYRDGGGQMLPADRRIKNPWVGQRLTEEKRSLLSSNVAKT